MFLKYSSNKDVINSLIFSTQPHIEKYDNFLGLPEIVELLRYILKKNTMFKIPVIGYFLIL